jgi:uncharacterized membrane-anchored protein
MKKITIGLFIAMCLLQWLVPAKVIYDSENLLREGIQYRFRTLPIDPSDPFRGKYITLNFEANSITLRDRADWKAGEVVFVSFTTDSAGFAQADVMYVTRQQTNLSRYSLNYPSTGFIWKNQKPRRQSKYI